MAPRILFEVILVLRERSTNDVRFIEHACDGVFDPFPPELQLEY